MSPKKFQNGVVKFLKRYNYSNARTEDLWVELQSEMTPDTNVSFIMDTWTRQMGYPVLSPQFKHGFIVVKQERFLENPDLPYNKSESPLGYRWEIPMQIEVGGGNGTSDLQTVLMHHNQEICTYGSKSHLIYKILIPVNSKSHHDNDFALP